MTILFSPSTKGYYHVEISASHPGDCVEITQDEFNEFVSAQSQGKQIVSLQKGKPVFGYPEISTEAAKLALKDKVQRHLDIKAQEYGFDDIKSASLRASFPNSPYHDIGVALGEWMDICWHEFDQILALVDSGAPVPDADEVVSALPSFED